MKAPLRRWIVRVVLGLALSATAWWARSGHEYATAAPKSRAEAQEKFRGPHGYADPATLSGVERLFGAGLPKAFAQSSRGGYAFEFVGMESPDTFHEPASDEEPRADEPRFTSYVYIASPESDATGPYRFALHSQDGLIHYTRDGRVPTTLDPSVSDGVDYAAVDSEPASDRNRPSLIERMWAGATRFRQQLFGSETGEERAIRDLQAFAAAQQLFYAKLGSRGFGSVEALTNPGSLVGVPDVAPFLDSEFTHAVRNGYRFTFAGESETTGGQRLYRDYSYVAVPTADGPAERRSFAVYDDGVVRVRTDGRTPLETDPPVTR